MAILSATPANFTSQVAAAVTGDIVRLGAGSYGSWSPSNITKGITIQALEGVQANFVTIRLTNVNGTNASNRFILDGLRFPGTAGRSLEWVLSDFIRVKNCTFLGGGNPIVFNRDTFLELDRNHVSGYDVNAIVFEQINTLHVHNNYFGSGGNNGENHDDVFQFFRTNTGRGPCTDVTVEDNVWDESKGYQGFFITNILASSVAPHTNVIIRDNFFSVAHPHTPSIGPNAAGSTRTCCDGLTITGNYAELNPRTTRSSAWAPKLRVAWYNKNVTLNNNSYPTSAALPTSGQIAGQGWSIGTHITNGNPPVGWVMPEAGPFSESDVITTPATLTSDQWNIGFNFADPKFDDPQLYVGGIVIETTSPAFDAVELQWKDASVSDKPLVRADTFPGQNFTNAAGSRRYIMQGSPLATDESAGREADVAHSNINIRYRLVAGGPWSAYSATGKSYTFVTAPAPAALTTDDWESVGVVAAPLLSNRSTLEIKLKAAGAIDDADLEFLSWVHPDSPTILRPTTAVRTGSDGQVVYRLEPLVAGGTEHSVAPGESIVGIKVQYKLTADEVVSLISTNSVTLTGPALPANNDIVQYSGAGSAPFVVNGMIFVIPPADGPPKFRMTTPPQYVIEGSETNTKLVLSFPELPVTGITWKAVYDGVLYESVDPHTSIEIPIAANQVRKPVRARAWAVDSGNRPSVALQFNLDQPSTIDEPDPPAPTIPVITTSITSETLTNNIVTEQFRIRGVHTNREITVRVMLPPDYYASGNTTEYQTLYCLQGQSSALDVFHVMTTARSTLLTKPMLLISFDNDKENNVTLDGSDSWFVNSPLIPHSQFTTFFFEELIPFIDDRYRTTGVAGRGVTGFSMGAFGSFHYMCENPAAFASVSGISGAYLDYTNGTHNFLAPLLGPRSSNLSRYEEISFDTRIDQIVAAGLVELPPMHLRVGLNEAALLAGTQEFRTYLLSKGFTEGVGNDFEYAEIAGGTHEFSFWRDEMDSLMDFHWRKATGT